MNAIAALLAAVSFSFVGTVFAQDAAPPAPSEEPKTEELKPQDWVPVTIEGSDYLLVESIAKFYGFNAPLREGDKVTLGNQKVMMILTIGSDEVLINGIKFKCTSKVLLHDGQAVVSRMDLSKLLDPVLRPSLIKGAGRDFSTVVIDPVFGGDAAGQENALGTEAGFAFQIAGKLKTELERRSYKVEFTRTQDENPGIGERVKRVRKLEGNPVVISLGFSSDAAVGGIRTRVMAPIGTPGLEGPLQEEDNAGMSGNAHENLSMALATAAHGNLIRRLGKNTSDLGIVRSRAPLLEQLDSPAIIIECGSMGHPYESRLSSSGAYQDAIARGVAEGVESYRRAVVEWNARKAEK